MASGNGISLIPIYVVFFQLALLIEIRLFRKQISRIENYLHGLTSECSHSKTFSSALILRQHSNINEKSILMIEVQNIRLKFYEIARCDIDGIEQLEK